VCLFGGEEPYVTGIGANREREWGYTLVAEKNDSPDGEAEERLHAVLTEWDALKERFFRPGAEEFSSADRRRFWELTVEGLDLFAFLFDRDVAPAGEAINPLESDLIRFVALSINETLSGVPPKTWGVSPKKGGQICTALELEAISSVSAYKRMIAEDIFDDDASTKYLSETFDVSGRTIQKWARVDTTEKRYIIWKKAVLSIEGQVTDPRTACMERMRRIINRTAMMRRWP
jgi:hypothetical protein